ncbi:LysE family translocator [Nisaea acidiphila]|uniref:LysE family translocator n=1 Tax=Nisaea acidiphila TaxID=1862145 RepID=A0A9J7AXR9_9PROT|nr:LysE family translocator [Nisaea acidiphila]UUX51233.1 LysE family translocator [Nisaea acidiphila]
MTVMEMTSSLLLLWLAAFPLMGSPGPATLSLAGLGTAYGFRAGLPYLGGIVLGTTCVLLMIASGVTALVLAEPALVTVLTAAAAVYILYLAWKIASAPAGVRSDGEGTAPGFLPALFLALANPKAFAAIGAVFASQTLLPGDYLTDSLAKIAALTIVILVVNTSWLAFGSLFARLLNDPRLGRAANIAFAAMLLASVALALSGI